MSDQDILDRINDLNEEKYRINNPAAEAGLGTDHTARARLAILEEQLNQCWNLLRQQRARAQAGDDPDSAGARSLNEAEAAGRTHVVLPPDPCCGACGTRTDPHKALFTPFSLGEAPGREIRPTLRFTCTKCGASTTLPVPVGWAPKGWEWYD